MSSHGPETPDGRSGGLVVIDLEAVSEGAGELTAQLGRIERKQDETLEKVNRVLAIYQQYEPLLKMAAKFTPRRGR